MTAIEQRSSAVPASRIASLIPRLACPACRDGVSANEGRLVCQKCGRAYPIVGEMAVLLDDESAAEIGAARGRAENIHLRAVLGRRPWMLRLANAFRPPHPFLFVQSRENRRKFSELVASSGPDAVILDVGSGLLKGLNASGLSQHVREHLVPLEIAPGEGIGVVGDAHKLPWRDASVDGLLIQGVLEHVRDPIAIAAEIFRVLKPGSPVYVEVPFIQHYHLDPLDFRRFTTYGLETLFGRFERLDSGVVAGPASALADILTEFPALLFRSPLLYWGTKFVTGWLTSPLRFLDLIWARLPRAYIAAGSVFFLGCRPAREAR